MIGLSCFRCNGAARGMLSALVVIASASVASCNLIGPGCNGTSCDDGLNIYFDGADVISGRGLFDGGTVDGGAPAGALEIDIATQMNQTFVLLEKCWVIGTEKQIVCDNDQGRPAYINGAIGFSGSDRRLLQVTFSMNGTQVSQQTVSPTYVMQTCACGAATSNIGTAHIQVPSS